MTKLYDGRSKTKLYAVWKTMKYRCSNKNNHKYKNYGAKGITVCDEWFDYENFKLWAYSNGYKEGLSIDRINVNGNYEPNNCRWVDMKTQQRNRTNNKMIEFEGIKRCLSEWCEITGLNHKTITYRLNNGWSTRKALTTPTRNMKSNKVRGTQKA